MTYTNSSQSVVGAGGINPDRDTRSTAAVTDCHNLRFVTLPTGDIVLKPVAPPSAVAASAWSPLVRASFCDGKNRLIVASGNSLGEIILDSQGRMIEGINLIAALDATPVCATADGFRLVVMTSRGPMTWLLGYDGNWLAVDRSKWPALSLMAVDGADCIADVPARRLSADYSDRSRPLTDTDRRSLTLDLRRAYLEVARQAASLGEMCAPMLVRYQLVGYDGEIIHVSPPQLLAASDSSRLTAPISVRSADRRSLPAYSVSARSWRLKVATTAPIPPDMAETVSRIEILASPQFHPYAPSAEASVSLVSEPSSDEMLRLTMPGADRSVSSGNACAAEARLKAAVGAMESLETIVAVIQGPFIDGQPLDVRPTVMGLMRSVADDCRILDEAIARGEIGEVIPTETQCLSAPHTFSASCGVSDAGHTLWGGLEPLRFDGYPLESFAAARAGQGAWHAAVAVSFSSGREQVVALSSGSSGAPISLNPLLSYPSPDAVSMTLMLSAGGVVRSSTVPLVPDSSGRRAVYVRPSFAPFTLDNEMPAFVVPAVRRVSRPMPSCVAVCRSRAPSSPIAVATLGDGCVNDVYVASRARSSWDFSKPRFSVFATSGTYTVTLSGSRAPTLSTSRIDSRVVGRGAACHVDGRLWAVAGDSLVEVGVSALKDLVSSVETGFLAYDLHNRELWISSPLRGQTTVFSTRDLCCYTRDEILSSTSVGGYTLVNGSLCRLGDETTPQSVFIRWDGQISFGDSYVSPRLLRLDMRATKLSYGSLTVRRMSLADAAPSPALRLSISGRLGAPLSAPLRSLPARRMSFSLQGRASPDTLISSLTICCSSLWKQTPSISLPKR